MYVELTDETGHFHYKGKVQVKLVFHLETGDYRKDEYPNGTPVHSHFIYIDPDGTNAETEALVENIETSLLDSFYEKWNSNTFVAPYILNTPVSFQQNPSQARIDACQAKADHLKTKKLKKSKTK